MSHDLYHFESILFEEGYGSIAGLDEVGRGPLAGPVVAAACILPRPSRYRNIDDSKKLSSGVREILAAELMQDDTVCFAVSVIDPKTIDRINILNASLIAMKEALVQLKQRPDFLLIDGHLPIRSDIPQKTLVKGDARSASIAAASILAKVHRDAIMVRHAEEYPGYAFEEHKGYATAKHREALKKLGPSPIHRMSFEPIRSLLAPQLPF